MIRVLRRNLKKIEKYLIADEQSPIISAAPINGDFLNWKIVLFLSNDRLLLKGKHTLHLECAPNHPFTAPKVKFITPIYHPNVNEKGEIDIWLLKDGWAASIGIHAVLLSICAIINEPTNVKSYLEDKTNFEYNREYVISYNQNKDKSYNLMDVLNAVKDLFADGFGSDYESDMQPIVFEYIGFSIDGDLNTCIKKLSSKNLEKQEKATIRMGQEIKLICLQYVNSFGSQKEVSIMSNARITKIRDVKREINKREGVPCDIFILFFHGRLLHDEDRLFECNIGHGALLMMAMSYIKGD